MSSFSTMSSSSTTTTAQSTESTSSDSGSGGLTSGTNYFFGFLVTFIVLLIIFIGCGLGTRHRIRARRAGFLDFGVLLDEPIPGVEQMEKPIYSEAWVVDPVVEKKSWAGIMPLSVGSSYDPHSDIGTPDLVGPSCHVPLPSANPHALNGLSLPSWSNTSREAKPLNGTLESLDVAVMIAMPTNTTARDSIRECEIGVISIPQPRHGAVT